MADHAKRATNAHCIGGDLCRYLTVISPRLCYLAPRPLGDAGRRHRWVVVTTPVVPVAAVAPTHQLTPMMFVLALVVQRWRPTRGGFYRLRPCTGISPRRHRRFRLKPVAVVHNSPSNRR